MKMKQINTLWGAAFHQKPTDSVLAFTAGRDVVGVPPADAALLPYDLWVSQAHAVMLGKTGIIPKADAAQIVAALKELESLVHAGTFSLDSHKEDVHTNIESWLTQKIGIEVAGKLHTARSRNDQIVTDMRLYMRDQVLLFVEHSAALSRVLIKLAEHYKGAPIPGFTHHQHAMVTTFGHTLSGFASMVIRDMERFQHWYTLYNRSPLGNTVSYGTSFPIDKTMTADMLGFDGPDHNSMDAITNRWEPEADLAFAIVTLMNHLSLMAETLILLATPEFGMVQLSDAYSTGSSIMPQKKNPDPLEVIKGKAGVAQGQLVSLLSMGKSNFMGYNRDSQWTKYIIMDVVNECVSSPIVLSGVLETMTVHIDVMESWCHKGFIGATTLMEQIVYVFHIPMRQAKMIVEKSVKESGNGSVIPYQSIQKVIKESGLTIPITEGQVTAWQDPRIILSLTKSYGGPGSHSMKETVKQLKKKLASIEAWRMRHRRR